MEKDNTLHCQDMFVGEGEEIRTEHLDNKVSIEEYMEKCVDVPTFLEYCKECRNYGKVWSCPPYDFSPEDYWRKYKTFQIVGMKIYVPEKLLTGTYTREEQDKILERILMPKKAELDISLLALEKNFPGSISLSGGACRKCLPKQCTRRQGEKCRHPEAMRYSVESLGGNVGLTVTKYLYQELKWMEEGKLPEYFILVGGLLLP